MPQIGYRQADVLVVQVHPGDASRFRRRQSEVAVPVHVGLVGAHRFADPGQDRGQRRNALIAKDEDGRLLPFDGPEFHLWLVVASGVEPDRDVLGSVLVDEEDPPQQDSLGIGERWRDKRLRGEEVADVEFLHLRLRLLLLHVTASGTHRGGMMGRLPSVRVLYV